MSKTQKLSSDSRIFRYSQLYTWEDQTLNITFHGKHILSQAGADSRERLRSAPKDSKRNSHSISQLGDSMINPEFITLQDDVNWT